MPDSWQNAKIVSERNALAAQSFGKQFISKDSTIFEKLRERAGV
jgi:hypothetical protein